MNRSQKIVKNERTISIEYKKSKTEKISSERKRAFQFLMYDKLKCLEIDMQEAPPHTYSEEQWNDLDNRIKEVEGLMEKACCVGALVDWPTLQQIRKIKEERQMIRYMTCLNQGVPEKEAGLSFDL